MNKKNQVNRGKRIKTKIVFIAVLIAITLVNANSAFAYWKSPVGMEIRDPAPSPFKEVQF